MDTQTCDCGSSDQTIDYILYECALINQERDSLISAVVKTDVWPIGKKHLIRKHYQPFVKYINKISFDKLTNDINPLNAELNPICHLLALLGAHHIFHVSVLRVNIFN